MPQEGTSQVAPSATRTRLPTVAVLLPPCLAAGLLVAAARLPVLTPDVWWHLATGRLVATSGLPRTDPFSYTLGDRPWIVHEWLAELGMYSVHAAGGWLGIVGWRAALIVLAGLAAYRLARLRASMPVALAVVVAAVYASQRNWLDRPQLASFVLAPVVVGLLELSRSGRRRAAWALPPLFALWVNLHGGFLLGFALCIAWFACEAAAGLRNAAGPRPPARRWVFVLLATALALCLNPHGPRGALYPLNYIGAGLRETIREERPGGLDSAYAWVHLALAGGLVAATLLRWRRTPAPHRGVAFLLVLLSMPRLGALSLPFAAERHAPLFLFAGAPLLAWHLEACRAGRGALLARRLDAAARTPQAWVLALALAGFAAWQALRALPRDGRTEARVLAGRFPEAGARWLATHRLPGPLVNPYRWGGYLIHALYPDYRVWIDSRGDLYGAARLREDELLYRMPPGAEAAVEQLLDRYDANVIVWYFLTLDFGPLRLHPFAAWLLQRPDWRLVFLDGPDPARRRRGPWGTTAIFLRVQARNAALLAALPPVPLPPGLPGAPR
jgi:hypothetical protein